MPRYVEESEGAPQSVPSPSAATKPITELARRRRSGLLGDAESLLVVEENADGSAFLRTHICMTPNSRRRSGGY